MPASNLLLDYERASDMDLAALVVRGDAEAVRIITRRNNQRLYRAAFSILRHRADAEEAVQEGYFKAFAAMESFMGQSALSTWLTRIVINEALERRRASERRTRLLQQRSVAIADHYRDAATVSSGTALSPEADAAKRQIAKLIEHAIADLPESFRLVFVLRDVEEVSVAETADILGIPADTVKTRLLRARRRLRQALDPELRGALDGVFPFAGADCDALTDRVLKRFTAV